MASQNNNNMNDINIENGGDIIPENGANFIQNGEYSVPIQQNGGHSVPSSAAVAVQEQYIINCADLISLNEVLTNIVSESKAIPTTTTEGVEKDVGVSNAVGQGSGKDSGFSISPESVSGLQGTVFHFSFSIFLRVLQGYKVPFRSLPLPLSLSLSVFSISLSV